MKLLKVMVFALLASFSTITMAGCGSLISEDNAYNTGYVDTTKLLGDLKEREESTSTKDVVKSCVAVALASNPATVWDNACSCMESIKKHCSWDSEDGIKASGGVSKGECGVFISFIK